jgi:hypothetical protein
MEKTLNQLMKELEIIATEHRQINEFFQGDFIDAVSRDAAQYPLMVVTLQPGTMTAQSVNINMIISICDKYNLQEYRQINEIHSDCLSICNDIRVTFQQWRFEEFMDIVGDIQTQPFINRGPDVTAGWTMAATVAIYDYNDWCSIPYDDYDFENGNPPPSGDCGDLTTTYQVYVNGTLEDTFTQDTTTNNTININL